jgi:hypothetical protein
VQTPRCLLGKRRGSTQGQQSGARGRQDARVDLAQLVSMPRISEPAEEPASTFNPKVAGSIPARPTPPELTRTDTKDRPAKGPPHPRRHEHSQDTANPKVTARQLHPENGTRGGVLARVRWLHDPPGSPEVQPLIGQPFRSRRAPALPSRAPRSMHVTRRPSRKRDLLPLATVVAASNPRPRARLATTHTSKRGEVLHSRGAPVGRPRDGARPALRRSAGGRAAGVVDAPSAERAERRSNLDPGEVVPGAATG